MQTRSSVDFIEEFNRALSSRTKKRIIQDVVESLHNENPYSPLAALHTLSREKKAGPIIPDRVHERVRVLIGRSSSGPESQKSALIYLKKYGLKEKDITGHLKSYDIFYNVMMDIDRTIGLRRVAASSLVSWGASWLTEHPVDSSELLDFCRREREKGITAPGLREAADLWINKYQDPQSGRERMDGALLSGMLDLLYLGWGPDPLPLFEFLNSGKGEIMEKGSDLHKRWLERVLPYLINLIEKVRSEAARSRGGRKTKRDVSKDVASILSPGRTRGLSYTGTTVSPYVEVHDSPYKVGRIHDVYDTGRLSIPYRDLMRWTSLEKT